MKNWENDCLFFIDIARTDFLFLNNCRICHEFFIGRRCLRKLLRLNKVPCLTNEIGFDKKRFEAEMGRLNPTQKTHFNAVYDLINAEFIKAYPRMTDQDKMRWKYQRYMEDYLRCVAAVDDNVGRVIDWLQARGEFDELMI